MITWNIVDNLQYWQPNTFVPVGGRRRYADSMYECITAGATGPDPSQGPTGTDTNIVDGNAHWKYVCHVDNISLDDWYNNSPSSLSDNVTVQLWRNVAPGYGDGEVVLNDFHFQWDKTTNGFKTTITAAPGESFADNIDIFPLWYNPNIGVAYNIQSMAGSAAFGASSSDLVISRLQFRTQVPLFSWAGSNIQVVGCISQQDGAPTFSAAGANCGLINCVIVDLIPVDQLTGLSAKWGQYQPSGSGVLLNTTFLSYTPSALIGGFLVRPNPSGSTIVQNCLAFGATDGLGNFAVDQDFGGSVQYNYNISDDQSFPNVPDGGNNAFGYAVTTIFDDPAGDLRLLSTSSARGAGIANNLVPGPVDITGYTRGPSWDVGAWQYRAMTPRYRRPSDQPPASPSFLPPGRTVPFPQFSRRKRTQ
jgi:hypothetical protein